MELTLANDFQNKLDQTTTSSILSHLTDTLSGMENIYLKARKENNTAYSGKIPWKSSKVLKKFYNPVYITTIMNIQTQ